MDGEARGISNVEQAELFHHVSAVILYCLDAQVELIGDPSVDAALRDEHQYFQFVWRQCL